MDTPNVDCREQFAAAYRARHEGKLSSSQIDATVARLMSPSNGTPANGGVVSALVYQYFGLGVVPFISPDHKFTGQSGGIVFPGGGSYSGTLYSDNLANLYANTVSFEFHCIPPGVYFGMMFFDGNSNLLAHFEGVPNLTFLGGMGGGTGSWASTVSDEKS
jgi:hypothetical protein